MKLQRITIQSDSNGRIVSARLQEAEPSFIFDLEWKDVRELKVENSTVMWSEDESTPIEVVFDPPPSGPVDARIAF